MVQKRAFQAVDDSAQNSFTSARRISMDVTLSYSVLREGQIEIGDAMPSLLYLSRLGVITNTRLAKVIFFALVTISSGNSWRKSTTCY
jgi:hypothetical protein